jgi:preprotein translocase subunit SecG
MGETGKNVNAQALTTLARMVEFGRCGNSLGTEMLMKKFVAVLAIAFATTAIAGSFDTASAKSGRSAYSAAQQKKFFDEALRLCRKSYGDRLHSVQVDYSKGVRYWCTHY